MGEDNWKECPKCRDAASSEAARLVEEAMDQYGKVDAMVYEATMQRARSHEAKVAGESFDTFAEYYEIRSLPAEGAVFISYEGQCRECGFKGPDVNGWIEAGVYAPGEYERRK